MTDTRESIRPLFVFGTLRDEDVRAVVLGRDPASVPTRAAVLPGQRTVTLPGETYPVLAPAEEAEAPGLLLELDAPALDRVAFFEGEEYGFDEARVRIAGGGCVPAIVCGDRTAPRGPRRAWSLEQWCRDHKPSFLPAVRAYMELYGGATLDEADRVWRSLSAR